MRSHPMSKSSSPISIIVYACLGLLAYFVLWYMSKRPMTPKKYRTMDAILSPRS